MAWLLDKIFGGDDLQAESDRLDAEHDALTAKKIAAGTYAVNPRWAEQHQANLHSDSSAYQQDVSKQLEDAFDEGWEEGKGNVSGFVGKIFGVAGDIIGSVLKGVPWWIWVGLVLYFAWPLIGAKLAKKFA